MQAEVERVAAEDVAHVVPADDHHLEANFFGDRLQPRRRHFARAADREPIAGDHERLAAMHAGAEVRHQVAERSGLPALVERVEALRDAIGRRRDLIGIDRVELLRRVLRIPDDQRLAANQRRGGGADNGEIGITRTGQGLDRNAGLENGRLCDLHNRSIVTCRSRHGSDAGARNSDAGTGTPVPGSTVRCPMKLTTDCHRSARLLAVVAAAPSPRRRAGEDRQRHPVEDSPRSGGQLPDHAHHALPHRRVWSAPHRLAEPEGGAGLDRQRDDAMGIEERASRAVVVRSSRLGQREAVGSRDLRRSRTALVDRSAGVDARHQRRGDRAGRAADRRRRSRRRTC